MAKNGSNRKRKKEEKKSNNTPIQAKYDPIRSSSQCYQSFVIHKRKCCCWFGSNFGAQSLK